MSMMNLGVSDTVELFIKAYDCTLSRIKNSFYSSTYKLNKSKFVK